MAENENIFGELSDTESCESGENGDNQSVTEEKDSSDSDENQTPSEPLPEEKKFSIMFQKMKLKQIRNKAWMDNIGPNRGMYF